MSLADWYSRARGRQSTPTTTLPLTDIQPPTAAPPAGLAHLLPQNDANGNATARDRKALEPLFGPNIGAVTSGPAWTSSQDKKVLTDELTPEVVGAWVERSKDPRQPTTTLQALVNLKRPSIRLSPLAPPPSAKDKHPLQHSLEFTYDADCPKVSITMHVYLPKNHPDAPGSAAYAPTPYAKLLVFEGVYEGGFNRKLKLEDGAVFELGRFEKVPSIRKRDDIIPPFQEASSSSSDSNANGLPTLANDNVNNSNNANGLTTRQKNRFTKAFRFTRHHHSHEHTPRIAGPALAVVDAHNEQQNGNPTANTTTQNGGAATPPGKSSSSDEEGVKITIRIVALDEQGTELAAPNEQVTYLHVVRVGQKPVKDTSANSNGTPDQDAKEGEDVEGDGEEEEEDTRPWVVKVVKREATIGPHTFHLHEIFGLTSSSAGDNDAPPNDNKENVDVNAIHTYPPTFGAGAVDSDPASGAAEECLLCLSSPREVVLLPCRHLVACKECALNMVEFGAGGAINNGDNTGNNASTVNPASPVAGGANAANGEGNVGEAQATQTGVVPTIINQRRKRKAKGWFCPVCRQPYTSLLRLTTAPPPPGSKEKDDSNEGGLTSGVNALSLNDAGANGTTGSDSNNDSSGGGGLLGLGNALRPAFLRNLTSSRSSGSANSNPNTNGTPETNARPGDVESVAGLGRVGS